MDLLRLQSSDRDFTEEDYEMLSNLDNNVVRMNSNQLKIYINRLPTYVFQTPDSPTKGEEVKAAADDEETSGGEVKNFCSVCLSNFESENKVKILPCLHQFHADCADNWL